MKIFYWAIANATPPVAATHGDAVLRGLRVHSPQQLSASNGSLMENFPIL